MKLWIFSRGSFMYSQGYCWTWSREGVFVVPARTRKSRRQGPAPPAPSKTRTLASQASAAVAFLFLSCHLGQLCRPLGVWLSILQLFPCPAGSHSSCSGQGKAVFCQEPQKSWHRNKNASWGLQRCINGFVTQPIFITCSLGASPLPELLLYF